MDKEEAEAIIETCLEAVYEQYVLPLALALGTLTEVACRDRGHAAEIASALRQQAESCPSDVAGRVLLQSLAGLAAGPVIPASGDVQDALRKSLRLVPGGKHPEVR